ncbi:hypothetical protein VS873_24045, partial [Salmonella enterica subsp. enterica serovar Typhi]|nr:hypothetical protein [Salmonella enterica subsp. enterica serovar Typhi]
RYFSPLLLMGGLPGRIITGIRRYPSRLAIGISDESVRWWRYFSPLLLMGGLPGRIITGIRRYPSRLAIGIS